MSIDIQECAICLTRYFPERLMCRTCSSSNFRTVKIEQGRVEERTMLSNGCALATIRISGDLLIMARVHPDVQLEDVVQMTDCGQIEPGQAYVPTRSLSQ